MRPFYENVALFQAILKQYKNERFWYIFHKYCHHIHKWINLWYPEFETIPDSLQGCIANLNEKLLYIKSMGRTFDTWILICPTSKVRPISDISRMRLYKIYGSHFWFMISQICDIKSAIINILTVAELRLSLSLLLSLSL